MLEFGLTPADFRSRYFERSPLLINNALHSPIVGWRQLNDMLNRIEPNERGFQLFQQGLVAQHTYTSDAIEFGRPRRRLHKAKFFEHLRTGATLVLNRIETHSLECQRLCAEIGRFAGLPATSNAYLSFTGDGTFGKHWDTHDVFAIQLFGRKRWQIYAPTFPLPLNQHTSDLFSQHQLGEIQLDVILERGDVLYLPRGWWHHVVPLSEPSLHLSVGTYAATMNDYLMWICSQLLPVQDEARQSFSPSRAAALGGDIFERLRRAAQDQQAIRQFEIELQMRERHHGEIDLARQVDALHVRIEDSARLRLTATVTTPLQARRHVVNGEWLQFDGLNQTIVTTLQSSTSLRFDALCQRIDAPRETVSRAVLELARLDVVSVEH